MAEFINGFVRPMLTDFYQISMCYGYWKNGKHMNPSTFDTFFRKAPFKGEFTVFGGLAEILNYLKNFRFSIEEIEFIKTLIPHGDTEFFDWLYTVDATQLKVSAVPDGTVVFPRTNVLRVEGPLAIAQLCETTVLVLTNYASLIATNAARFRIAAGQDKRLLEFGLRRAQGPDGAMTASKYSYLGGFDSTSNTLGAFLFGIPCSGTHAHAYVSAFVDESDLPNRMLDGTDLLELAKQYRKDNGFATNNGELVAFVSYALAFPNAFLALVDTYDSLRSGVPNFLCVALALHKLGYTSVGIRLDSGDLAYLSIAVRGVFASISKKYNVPFERLKIVASNDINEGVIHALNEQNHEIDVFGVGTNLVTCQLQPALGMVYKLVEINNTPRIKLSNDRQKITIPGKKTLYRLFGTQGVALCDLLVAQDSVVPGVGEKIVCRHPFDDRKRAYVLPSRVQQLHKVIWDGGPVGTLPTLTESREYLKMQLREQIRTDVTRSSNPTPYKVSVSEELHRFIQSSWERELPVEELK